MVLARLVQLAAVEPEDNVLDIGCATGYSTAVLACLARRVVGLEPEPELAEAARRMLRELAIENATIVEGALAAGTPEDGPYDVILLNGSVEEIPASVLGQLREGARLVAILASGANNARPGKAYLFVKIDGEASGLPHFDAGARALPGFSPRAGFRLLGLLGTVAPIPQWLDLFTNPAQSSFSWVSLPAYAALWFQPQWGWGRHQLAGEWKCKASWAGTTCRPARECRGGSVAGLLL